MYMELGLVVVRNKDGYGGGGVVNMEMSVVAQGWV